MASYVIPQQTFGYTPSFPASNNTVRQSNPGQRLCTFFAYLCFRGGITTLIAGHQRMKAARLAVRKGNGALLNSLKKRCLGNESSLAGVPCPPTFKRLLFSESLADVVFTTNSNEKIFAHKCVLAAASTSMESMAMGPWLENQIGTASVSHVEILQSSTTMKLFLEFIYTGTKDSVFDTTLQIFSANLMEFFDVAALYEVPEFAQKIEALGIDVLLQPHPSKDAVAAITVAAYFHDRRQLKEACAEYIKRQGTPLRGDLYSPTPFMYPSPPFSHQYVPSISIQSISFIREIIPDHMAIVTERYGWHQQPRV